MKILCLASGKGSNFEAILKACQSGEIPRSEVVALLCNKADAPVLDIARRAGVAHFVIESRDYIQQNARAAYDKKLTDVAAKYSPDIVCLAGYMLVLGEPFLKKFKGKILNIHPALLPEFPGLNAVRQALTAKAKRTGCTVHYVDSSLDGGPIVDKTEVPVLPDDNEATLSARIRTAEHATYVRVLQKLAAQQLQNG